mmetsp:Transcript_1696/g.3040  ORF Transcript_1696/g.3040 Transcript_1696/m.3040 type:complete len:95 (-) Transcript_1696:668-952(-)
MMIMKKMMKISINIASVGRKIGRRRGSIFVRGALRPSSKKMQRVGSSCAGTRVICILQTGHLKEHKFSFTRLSALSSKTSIVIEVGNYDSSLSI